MLGRAGVAGLNHRQRWWREKRPLQIEEQACALIRRYEAKRGRLPGIIVSPALLVPEVGCDLVYFAGDEREGYGVPANAIGALDTERLLVLIHAAIETPGREGHTIGEEIGHAVLHAKLVSPEQQALDLGVASSQGIRLFTRTEEGAFNDGRQEPTWMSIEAGYFAACLMMPRDRYGDAARACLEQAVRASLRSGGRFAPVEQRMAEARRFLDSVEQAGYDLAQCNLVMPELSDGHLLEMALDALEPQHGREVSRVAQKRRFVELGLAHDLADQVAGPRGERVLSSLQFLFVADQVVEAARRAPLPGTTAAPSARSGVKA